MDRVLFEDRKAMRKFYDISIALKGLRKIAFTKKVKKLFDTKITSEEGEFDSFNITVDDLECLASSFN